MSAHSPVGSRHIKTALGLDVFAKLGESQKGEHVFIIWWKTTSVIGKILFDLWIGFAETLCSSFDWCTILKNVYRRNYEISG